MLNHLDTRFPGRFRFVESFKQGKELVDKEQHQFIASGNLRPGSIFDTGLIKKGNSAVSAETMHPAERLADKAIDQANRST